MPCFHANLNRCQVFAAAATVLGHCHSTGLGEQALWHQFRGAHNPSRRCLPVHTTKAAGRAGIRYRRHSIPLAGPQQRCDSHPWRQVDRAPRLCVSASGEATSVVDHARASGQEGGWETISRLARTHAAAVADTGVFHPLPDPSDGQLGRRRAHRPAGCAGGI